MSHIKFVLILLFFFASAKTFAQIRSYKADDGATVDLEVLSGHADDGRKKSVYIGAFGPEGIKSFGFSYHKPKKFYINALAGSGGAQLDGNYVFSTRVIKRSAGGSVMRKGNTLYIPKLDARQRISYAYHGGVNYSQYSDEIMADPASFSSVGVILGVSRIRSSHVSLLVHDKKKFKKSGTSISRWNADILIYVHRELFDPAPGHELSITLNEVSRAWGARFYHEGKVSFWNRKGNLFLHYMFGLSIGSNKWNKHPYFFGFGFGYGW